MLAMEAHTEVDVDVSERDVNRVEAGIRGGKSKLEVFPKLTGLTSEAKGKESFSRCVSPGKEKVLRFAM